MKENIKPTPENSWMTMSERDILQAGKFRDWDNKELVIIAGSLQRCAKALEFSTQNENYTVKYFYAQNEIDDLREIIDGYKKEIKEWKGKYEMLNGELHFVNGELAKEKENHIVPKVKKWWQKIFS